MAHPETEDVRLEAASLAAGLAGILRRKRAFGLRRTGVVQAPAPVSPGRRAPQPPPQAAPQAPPQAAGHPAQTAPPQAAPAAPPAAPAPPAASPAYEPPAAAPAAATSAAVPPAASAPRPAAELPPLDQIDTLQALSQAAASCGACALASSRHQVVFAGGSGASGVLFLDEAPSAETDATGDFFRGPGGPLLADIITKGMGLPIGDVQIASLVKCLPPGGRPPEQDELTVCRSWLERQIELLAPKVIVTLGRPATAGLLGIDAPLPRLRGTAHPFGPTIKVIATFHPAYLTRAPQHKKDAWQDIQLAMQIAGIQRPAPPAGPK